VVSDTIQRAAETAVTTRYETLIRVSQTLISNRSSEELFSILARELRAVVNFYVMGVGIYDENAHEMRTTSYGEPGVPLQAPKFAPEETFSWWVYQHQQPLIIPSLDAETRFPAVAEMLKSRGVRSVCALPLTTVHRRLGGLAVGSIEADAYSSEEVSFLSLVANQVALAVDDALNVDASQDAKDALRASEESFRQIVDSIPAFAWYAGPDGKIEYLNQRILDYTAERHENLVGFGWANVLHSEDVDRTKKAWLHSVETGEPCDVDQRVRRFDNNYRWFRTTAQPLRDKSGRVIRWYGVATDIEDWKRAEEGLRERELNLRLVVDSIPGLVCTMSAAGEFQLFNRQILEYFGKTPEELKSWATSDLVHPDDLPRVIAAFTSSIETGHPYDSEHRCRRADGVYRWFQVRALPVRDAEGRIISWYILFTDIDGRKQAENRLQLLLDVTNQVVSNLQLRDLLRAISASVRRVMQCDLVGVFLPDSERNKLQTFVLDFPESKGFIREEYCSMEGSLGGFVFRTGKPWTGNTSDLLQLGVKDDPIIPEGLKAGCMLPLVSRNRVLGLLGLGRREENAFSQVDIGFLKQVASQIAIAVENALEYGQITEAKERLAEHKFYLEDEIRLEHNFEEIIGNSPRLKAVLESVRIVAPSNSTVLIQGETGTGKEVIARAIHNLSSRKGQAFVKVNCAAIPLGLLESELFGHEKGSFTGAIARRIGRFELAHKGTLFLDEVGDIPLELQSKLLRVLQEQEFERLGSTRTQHVDVRLLAATNASLTQMVAEKKFRSDLYYRLKVFPIDVPPLRDRRDDIPLLIRYFANKYARRIGKQIKSIPKETMDALSHYSWPGNIRELQNLMERAVLLSTGPSLRVPLAEILTGSGLSAASGGNALEQAEREQIVRALRESNWVVGGLRGAAARLGLKRTSLAYKMQKLGISRPPQ
jgi:formate hydrogenlyase transcriptional activator